MITQLNPLKKTSFSQFKSRFTPLIDRVVKVLQSDETYLHFPSNYEQQIRDGILELFEKMYAEYPRNPIDDRDIQLLKSTSEYQEISRISVPCPFGIRINTGESFIDMREDDYPLDGSLLPMVDEVVCTHPSVYQMITGLGYWYELEECKTYTFYEPISVFHTFRWYVNQLTWFFQRGYFAFENVTPITQFKGFSKSLVIQLASHLYFKNISNVDIYMKKIPLDLLSEFYQTLDKNFGICNEVIIAQFLQSKGFGDQGIFHILDIEGLEKLVHLKKRINLQVVYFLYDDFEVNNILLQLLQRKEEIMNLVDMNRIHYDIYQSMM